MKVTVSVRFLAVMVPVFAVEVITVRFLAGWGARL